MKNIFALTIPGVNGKPEVIAAPSGIPTGGLEGDGGKLITNGIAIFLIFCVLVSFGFVIYGGLNYIMSEGDKTKVQSARRTITFAIIGLIVALLSFFFLNFIGKALGADFFKASI
jgi:hypothetical protein